MISGYSLHNFPVDFLDFITEEQILVQVFNSGWINLMKSDVEHKNRPLGYPIKIEEWEKNAQYLISEFIVYSGISIDGD